MRARDRRLSLPVLMMLSLTAHAQETPAPAESDTADGQAVQLEPITVTGSREIGYAPDRAAAGAKGDLPLRDIPQSVTVLNEALIRDLAPRQLDELADYVAGVDREAVQGNPYAISFFVRGFNTAGGASSYNGFRENGFNTPQAAINIERIEFLKGPASVLSGGNGALSGLVNIVSKRPLPEQHNRIEASVGSFDHLMTAIDSTGPLNADKSLRYRLTASADKDGNFVEQTRQQSLFVSPYLSWDIGANTQLDVELLNQDIERPGREPYFLRHPDFFKIPLETQLGDPGNPAGAGGELTRRLARAELTHRFGNGLQLRQALFLHNVRSDDTTVQPLSYNAETQELSRRVRAVDEYQRERSSQTELSGEFATGTFGHQWLAGLELSRQTTGYIFNVAPYSPINIFDPQYPGQQSGELTVPFPGVDSEFNTQALYLQDLIAMGGGVKLMLGLRYDELETVTQERTDGSVASRQTDDQLSPRLGLIYQPSTPIAYYASWGHSFRPSSGRDANGSRFDPERGEQYEVGVKFEPLPALTLNAALFEYTRQNILTTDPDNPDFNIAVGEQRARGLELEAIGRLMRDWQIVASYSWLDAEVTEDNRLPVGDRRQGVPRHSASLFNRVDLTALGLERWSVTAGVAYAGDRESGLPNDPAGDLTAADVRLPSYTRYDAGLIYRGAAFEARLNGRNLTDERIYDGYNSTFQARAPRSMELSVAVTF
ncbi:MAG TPA: TonB-dependent siderophore receptor [Solimonas sp.]